MKYDYGQAVICALSTAEGIVTMKPCSVVAITPIENSEQVEQFGYSIGTVMYTVEFGDGSDTFVAEQDLSEFQVLKVKGFELPLDPEWNCTSMRIRLGVDLDIGRREQERARPGIVFEIERAAFAAVDEDRSQ